MPIRRGVFGTSNMTTQIFSVLRMMGISKVEFNNFKVTIFMGNKAHKNILKFI